MRLWLAAFFALAGCEKVLGLDEVGVHAPGRVALAFDNSSSASDLVDFPVLVPLDPSVIEYSRVADPTTDLHFHDADGDLPFEVESWDPSGESIVWVAVPRITAGSTTDQIFLDVTGSTPTPAAVWTDFAFVFHGGDLVDSVDPADVGMPSGAPGVGPAWIGNGVVLDGSFGQHVTFAQTQALLAGWPTFSAEMWVHPDFDDSLLLGGLEYHVFADPGGPLTLGRIFNGGKVDGQPLNLQQDVHYTADAQYPQAYLPNRRWSYFVFAYDGQTLWVYRNGVALGTLTNPTPETLQSAAGAGITIGGESGYRGLIGMVDEVRVSRAFHDQDWVLAQYLSMSRHFVSFTER